MPDSQFPVNTVHITEEDIMNANRDMVVSLDSFTYKYGLGCTHRYQLLLVDRGEED